MANPVKTIVVNAVINGLFFIRSFFLIPHGVCRYTPSCSAYAQQALLKLPLHKAIFSIVKRVVRCNPFSKGGYDPLAE